MARSSKRTYDVVVYGATGFTGRLVAEYLAEAYGFDRLKWALAGRNADKLERERASLAKRWPAAAGLPLIIADSFDPESLQVMARSTRVVCTTVGPYAKYGALLVATCAAEGTDYCDLTGETQFIRRMLDDHHATAQRSGARIVHCCGFDSIPSDLGALVFQEHAIAAHGQPADAITLYTWRTKGGASGGTIASMMNVADEARRDPATRKVLFDPYALNPEGQRQGPDGRDLMGPEYDPVIGSWVGPWVMAAINTRVVRRTNALLGYKYGESFKYREVMRFGDGLRGRASATAFSLGLGGFMAGVAAPPVRRLMQRWLPGPGEGPSREAQSAGMFELRLIGTVRGADIRVKVRGEKDPGYGATAIMLGESAVCLAKDRRETLKTKGILTPAAAMGMVLVERLRRAGMTFEVM